MTLAPYIQELLVHRNYVILSGFGAFQPGKLLPVEVNENGELTPPRRLISFNPLLTYSDYALAQYIADREQRELEEVVEALSQLVFEWKSTLNQGREVVVSGLGTFVKTTGLIELKPEQALKIQRESFGLPVIKPVVIKQEVEAPKEREYHAASETVIEEQDQAIELVNAEGASTRAWYTAAMISFAAAAACMLYVFFSLYLSLFS